MRKIVEYLVIVGCIVLAGIFAVALIDNIFMSNAMGTAISAVIFVILYLASVLAGYYSEQE